MAKVEDWYCTYGLDIDGDGTVESKQNFAKVGILQAVQDRCLVILVKVQGDLDPWNPVNFAGGHSMHDYLSSTYNLSFRNYFEDMSHGDHILSSRIDGQADITSWYEITSTTSIDQIILRAIQAVDNDPNRVFHWSDYDGDNNNYVDQIMVIPGGSTIGNIGSTARFINNYTTTEGEIINQEVPITRGKEIWGFLVGNMAHEYGHVLGLPELYDRSGLPGTQWANDPAKDHSAGVGNYCVMGWDYWSPALVCSLARATLGWIDIIYISTSASGYTFQLSQAYRFQIFGEERFVFHGLHIF